MRTEASGYRNCKGEITRVLYVKTLGTELIDIEIEWDCLKSGS